MSRKQSRKSISVTGDLYYRIAAYSTKHGIPVTQVVARAVESVLGEEPAPVPPSSTVAIPVSETVQEHAVAAATRLGITPSSVLDTGVNRMLDRLERQKLCRSCLQSTAECECA